MRHLRRAAFALLAASTVAASSAPALANPMPPISQAGPRPAPPVARLIAACFADAAARNAIRRDGRYLLFDCAGEPAHAYFDLLGRTEAGKATETRDEGRTWRFTEKPEKDLVGLDACWSDGQGGYGCTLIYNAGSVLNATP